MEIKSCNNGLRAEVFSGETLVVSLCRVGSEYTVITPNNVARGYDNLAGALEDVIKCYQSFKFWEEWQNELHA